MKKTMRAIATFALILASCVLLIELLGPLMPYVGESIADIGRRRSLILDVDHFYRPDKGVDFNEDGIRCDRSSSAFRKGDFNVIFLGDSFTAGYRLYPFQAFPQQFEGLVRATCPDVSTNAANFAWISSAPYLSLRLLKKIGSKYNPRLIFMCIDATDFHDEVKYRAVLERKRVFHFADAMPTAVSLVMGFSASMGRKSPMLASLSESIIGFPLDRFFILNKPLTETSHYCEGLKRSLADIHTFAKDTLNARLVVVVLPRGAQYGSKESPASWERHDYPVLGPYVLEPFAYFEALSREVDYPIVSLLPAFRQASVFPTCFYDDPHWTEAGHTVAAEAIFSWCRQEGYLPCP